jgi:hypothetical protein
MSRAADGVGPDQTAGGREGPDSADELLEQLGVYTNDDIQQSAYARVLVLGPAKGGKTTCLALSAPSPLIINCDGPNATKGAANQGAKFLSIDASNRKSWNHAIKVAQQLVESGRVKTVIVDTISLLADFLHDDIATTLSGFDLWRELEEQLMLKGLKKLFNLEAHLFITAHMAPTHESIAGVLPVLKGSSKTRIPAFVDDWVMLDVKPGLTPHERMFLLGAQENWSASGRNIKRTCAVAATVPALFEELGIKL